MCWSGDRIEEDEDGDDGLLATNDEIDIVAFLGGGLKVGEAGEVLECWKPEDEVL